MNEKTVEMQIRLDAAREGGFPWKKWGPYLSERQWGTVREDYSQDGKCVPLFEPSTTGVIQMFVWLYP